MLDRLKSYSTYKFKAPTSSTVLPRSKVRLLCRSVFQFDEILGTIHGTISSGVPPPQSPLDMIQNISGFMQTSDTEPSI